MSQIDEENVFRSGTTYQNAYRPQKVQKRTTYNYDRNHQEEPVKPSATPVPTDHQSFAPWKKGVVIPFDLLLTPKEIVNTHPKTPFVKVKSMLESQTAEIIKTRPRVNMAPACCLDDVPDPAMRKLLVDQTYTTAWRKAEREATDDFKPLEPCISEIGQKDTVGLEIDLFPPLGENFRTKGKEWDENQIRAACDPTEDFWLTKDPPVVCGACVDPFREVVAEETKQTIKGLIKNEQLRLPHDKLSPSYAGHKPMLAMDVPLARSPCPFTHPLLSTYQATIGRRLVAEK